MCIRGVYCAHICYAQVTDSMKEYWFAALVCLQTISLQQLGVHLRHKVQLNAALRKVHLLKTLLVKSLV